MDNGLSEFGYICYRIKYLLCPPEQIGPISHLADNWTFSSNLDAKSMSASTDQAPN